MCPLTLACVLVSLTVHHLFDAAAVEQACRRVLVKGLEGLAGAVGLLGGHAAVVRVARRARVAPLLLAPSLGERAVRPAFLHIHPGRMLCWPAAAR